MYYDTDIWPLLPNTDVWIYDKLILSRMLGYKCGPCGIPVPFPAEYIVRPIINLEGQGKGAEKIFIEKDTWHLPYGFFWQELFKGRHLSIDFHNGKQIRCTEGFRDGESFIHFSRWIQVADKPKLPNFINDIIARYTDVNVEIIDNNVIEMHLRKNKDFDDDPIEIIPVWEDREINVPKNFIFCKDTTDERPRLGCYKRYK